MLQLTPSETITVNRFLLDHNDSTTYYVQAKVYNSDTHTLITTLNLTKDGSNSRLFSKAYKVPYDNVFGTGKRIFIITSVYTDSGYTTPAVSQLDDFEEYLVQQRWNPTSYLGGNSEAKSSSVEAVKAIQDGFNEIKSKFTELEPVTFPESIDPKAITAEIIARIDALKFPEPIPQKPVDFTPILLWFDKIFKLISSLPQFEKTDLLPILAELESMKKSIFTIHSDYLQAVDKKLVPVAQENAILKGNKKEVYINKLKKRYGIS